MRPPVDNIAPIDGRCAICGSDLPAPKVGSSPGGRRRVTCKAACKQELHRRRRRARAGGVDVA